MPANGCLCVPAWRRRAIVVCSFSSSFSFLFSSLHQRHPEMHTCAGKQLRAVRHVGQNVQNQIFSAAVRLLIKADSSAAVSDIDLLASIFPTLFPSLLLMSTVSSYKEWRLRQDSWRKLKCELRKLQQTALALFLIFQSPQNPSCLQENNHLWVKHWFFSGCKKSSS